MDVALPTRSAFCSRMHDTPDPLVTEHSMWLVVLTSSLALVYTVHLGLQTCEMAKLSSTHLSSSRDLFRSNLHLQYFLPNCCFFVESFHTCRLCIPKRCLSWTESFWPTCHDSASFVLSSSISTEQQRTHHRYDRYKPQVAVRLMHTHEPSVSIFSMSQ